MHVCGGGCLILPWKGRRAKKSFAMMATRQLLAPLVGGRRMYAALHCTYCRGEGGRGETQRREEVYWEVRYFIYRAVYTSGRGEVDQRWGLGGVRNVVGVTEEGNKLLVSVWGVMCLSV